VSSDEKLAALRTLGRFEDIELINRTLSYLMDDKGTILNQDIHIPMHGLRGDVNGISALWGWTQDNWEKLSTKLPPGLSMLGSIVSISTSGFTSFDKIEEIKQFYENKSTKGFDQGLAQSLDTIKAKAQWVERDRNVVLQYLKEHGYYK